MVAIDRGVIDVQWIIHQVIDLLRGYVDVNTWPESLMIPGDDAAHVLEVEIKRGGQPVDLYGCAAKTTFTRADNTGVVLDCTISGNLIKVELTPECYAIPGQLRAVMKVTNPDGVMTACETFFRVRMPGPDQVVDPGNVIPSIEVLLARLQQMADATDAATIAAKSANEAADRANAAADKLNWDFLASDDGEGNVTLSGLVDVMDDGNGNVSIGPFAGTS